MDSPEDQEKLIIFGWITVVFGAPENGDPTKYNELTDKIYEFISQDRHRIRTELLEALPDGCEWCDFKGYTETGGMAMEDDLVEAQPCEYCSDYRESATKVINEVLGKEQS